MSVANSRRGPAGGIELVGVWFLVLGIGLVTGLTWSATALASVFVDGSKPLPRNPFAHVVEVVTGHAEWGRAEWVALGVIVATTIGLGLGVLGALRRRMRRRPLIDRAAGHLAHGHELDALRTRGATATAQRLSTSQHPGTAGPAGTGPSIPASAGRPLSAPGAGSPSTWPAWRSPQQAEQPSQSPIGPGLPIGRAIAVGAQLYSSWEDVSIDIWGPRTGKTTSRAVPAILAAPGALIVTSNKRDIVDATRGIRESRGRAWIFDPQQIIGEAAGWWWNPLSYVSDEVQARVLADLFAAGSRNAGARTDAFFDSAGKDLLAGLLLAAAVAGRPITDVYEWLCDPGNDEPVELLTEAGYRLIASSVASAVLAPERQRAGIYATAQQAVTFLTNRGVREWIVRPDGLDKRPEFSPSELVLRGEALYAVSKEGRGSLGPLVAALTVAVTEAAEQQAKSSPGGRLPVPLVAVLDEAANVCRWPDLPDLYSHYGSRGIVIMTILQSWSQGVSVWGREGMRKLWSAANIRVFGGGVAEVEFLGELASLVGEYQRPDRSRTHAVGGGSTSHSLRSEKLLDVADLAAMPRGRALLIPSGARPVLISTQPWMDSPAADRIRASIARFDPASGGR